MARITIITCLWRRPLLSGPVLAWYRRIADASAHSISLLAVGSEGEGSRGLAESAGWDYIEFPNRFVQKWNEASKASREYDPDFVSWVGSSTPVSLDYYDRVPLREGLTGLRDMWCFDVPTRTLAYWPGYEAARQPNPGPARIASRDIMEKLNWELWPENTWPGGLLDGGSNMSTASVGAAVHIPTMTELGCLCVDVKSTISKTPFRDLPYARSARGEDAMRILQPFEMEWLLSLEREDS